MCNQHITYLLPWNIRNDSYQINWDHFKACIDGLMQAEKQRKLGEHCISAGTSEVTNVTSPSSTPEREYSVIYQQHSKVPSASLRIKWSEMFLSSVSVRKAEKQTSAETIDDSRKHEAGEPKRRVGNDERVNFTKQLGEFVCLCDIGRDALSYCILLLRQDAQALLAHPEVEGQSRKRGVLSGSWSPFWVPGRGSQEQV